MPMTEEEIAEHKQSLSLLSPEERAAMEDDDDADIIQSIADGKKDDDDDADEGTAAQKHDQKQKSNADADEDDGDDDDSDDADDDAAVAAKAEVDAAAAAAKAATDEAAAQAATDKATVFEPIVADLTPIEEAYQARIADMDVQKAGQLEKMMAGEISAKEYSEFEAKYMRDRDAARDEKAANISWFTEVTDFKNTVLKNDGINYETDAEKGAALDDWVKRLAANPKFSDKDGKWFLDEAHKKVKIEFGAGEKEAPAAPAKVVVKPKGRAPDLTKLPPTLAGLPAAAENETGNDGEFSHLDKLDGMNLERALAKLTPDQRERYEMAS